MINLKSLVISGKEVLPIVEGGKGISISNGESSGAFAAAYCVGTFSAVNADSYDEKGHLIPIIYKGKTRVERRLELIKYAINGGIYQARIAYEKANGCGRIHMNVLWEMGAVEEILNGILSKVSHLIHGVTCGAGMPFRLAEICARYSVYFYPIVSSARAFHILWKRAYSRFAKWLGGVVYEDPWLAGGHNGLSNSENPLLNEAPMARVIALRRAMKECNLDNMPIFMAGGVWNLNEWSDWMDNDDVGPIAFQFGTRPLLTTESPISDAWKKKLLTLKEGDVSLNRFSPTGFYSSAVNNTFLKELKERSDRQLMYAGILSDEYNIPFWISKKSCVYLRERDKKLVDKWQSKGFTETMRTSGSTIIFISLDKKKEIISDQAKCIGCLSSCLFSSWSQHSEKNITGKISDPRYFCIQKTLQSISHLGSVENNLMFVGHQGYRFAKDPFYKNGFIPTVKQLVERIRTGL
ncbi:MAG: NAD(P)H-dependent flavin oxidoreductase [Alphaproteobacteria bacterium]